MADALDPIRQLVETHGQDLAFVVNHSGGKDSTRMLGFVRQHFPDATLYGVMADTGFEHKKTVTAMDWARLRCRELGVDLSVVRNSKRTYLEMVEQRGMFPSAQYRQCTSDLKRIPIDKFIRGLPQAVVINCLGIRAEESSPRSKLTPWKVNEQLTTRHRIVYSWLPIFNLSLAEVLDWHRMQRVPLHPVYAPEYHWDGTTGGYLRRLSCRVCIFSSDADLVAIYQHDREAFDAVSQLEMRIGFTMRPGSSLVQIVQSVDETSHLHSLQQHFCFPSQL